MCLGTLQKCPVSEYQQHMVCLRDRKTTIFVSILLLSGPMVTEMILKFELIFMIFAHYLYAPNFEEFGGAYCFGIIRMSICPSVSHAFLVS